MATDGGVATGGARMHRGYSSTMMDHTHFALLGARNGALVFDEVFTLSVLSPPPKPLLAPLPLAMEALLPPPPAYEDAPPSARAAAKGKGKRQHSLEQQRCQVVEKRRQQAERSPGETRGSGAPPDQRTDSGSNSGASSGAGSDESVKCRQSVQYKRHAAAPNPGAGWPTMARHSFHSGRSNNRCASPTPSLTIVIRLSSVARATRAHLCSLLVNQSTAGTHPLSLARAVWCFGQLLGVAVSVAIAVAGQHTGQQRRGHRWVAGADGDIVQGVGGGGQRHQLRRRAALFDAPPQSVRGGYAVAAVAAVRE